MGSPEGKRVCVVGAGFGGLALAIRLQAAGVATTLLEARDQPGGATGCWQDDGFTFDAGPGVITDPAAFHALWDLTAHSLIDDVELLPVAPLCRFTWPDGTVFDWSNDLAVLRKEVARRDPAAVAGYDRFLDFASVAQQEGRDLAARSRLHWRDTLRAFPALAHARAWRPLHRVVSRFVRDDKLRQVLCFPAQLVGANPLTASAMTASLHKLAMDNGAWWPRGGTNRLAAAMVRQFERLGGTVRFADPVAAIETMGIRAAEVVTQSGWRGAFDAVASNADAIHTYRDLLGATLHGPRTARKWAARRYAPGLFSVHFAVEGAWPGIPHQTTLFGSRYEGLLEAVHRHGVLPADLAIWLTHPTVTDPSLAPEGMSVFQAAVPVAHQGRLTVDWKQVGPELERRVLDEIGRRLIPDIHDRLVLRFHRTPRDTALDLGAHLGSAFGLEPVPTQIGLFGVSHRDAVIDNLYFVGAATCPGGGLSGVLAGAEATVRLMVEDMSR